MNVRRYSVILGRGAVALCAAAIAVIVIAFLATRRDSRVPPDSTSLESARNTELVHAKQDSDRLLESARQPVDIVFVKSASDPWDRGVQSRSLGTLARGENKQLWQAVEDAPKRNRSQLLELRSHVDPTNMEDVEKEGRAILSLVKSEATLESLRRGDYITLPKGHGSQLLGNTDSHVFLLHGGWVKDGEPAHVSPEPV